MTAELIATIVGMIVSVALEVIPGIKDKWNVWKWKRLTLLVGFVAVPVIVWALGCFADISFIQQNFTCDVQGGLMAAGLGFLAFVGNQGAFGYAVRNFSNAQSRQPQCRCK